MYLNNKVVSLLFEIFVYSLNTLKNVQSVPVSLTVLDALRNTKETNMWSLAALILPTTKL